MQDSNFECVIGIEIHAQLKTKSKMFSADAAEFGGGDNEYVSPVSLGMPGALPTVNREAVAMAIKVGLALGCNIRRVSRFARKNYFYPDLPKGYQISQYDEPICEKGEVIIELEGGASKKISIIRAHLEEDAGKSQHFGDHTLVNFNRSGVPLLEIVSGPDLSSPAEAATYARTIRQMLRYLDVCDGNLEEGSMRCDCNISLRPKGSAQFGTRVEVKNINSFRFIEKAMEFEFERQRALLLNGEKVIQETRLWDPDRQQTFSMRVKEEADDYRYFPDPDLLPLKIEESFISILRNELPELPIARRDRFIQSYGLSRYDANLITTEKEYADYFERAVEVAKNPKGVANWIMTEVFRRLKDTSFSIMEIPLTPVRLGKLVKLIDEGTLSSKMAKSIFQFIWDHSCDPEEAIKSLGFQQISDDSEIIRVIEQVLGENPQAVQEYRAGKTKSFGFLVGQVMKRTQGQANPQKVNTLLKQKLEST